jgi:hypothetical protein
MRDPPSGGAVQVTTAEASPGVALTPVGAWGAVTGVVELLAKTTSTQ